MTTTPIASMSMQQLLEELEASGVPVAASTEPSGNSPRRVHREIVLRLEAALGKADIVDIIDPVVPQIAEERAMSVAAIVRQEAIAQTDFGGHWLLNRRYGEIHGFAATEQWSDQPTICAVNDKVSYLRHPPLISSTTHATAFLVRSDMLATARHCISRPLQTLCFVFDFSMITGGFCHCLFRPGDVYYPKASAPIEGTEDWALIQLDRNVEYRQPLPLAGSAAVKGGMGICAIGHPHGLPAKYSHQSTVTRKDAKSFQSNLRVYGGNSGGPVFDADTHSVLGIASQLGSSDVTRAIQRIDGRSTLLPTEPETEGSVTCVMLDDLIAALAKAP